MIDFSKYKVLLIGVSKYLKDVENLPPIPNIEQNISKLNKIFQDSNIFGIPDKNIVSSLDDNSTEITDRIVDFLGAVRKEETLIFYYAGHGKQDEKNKVYFTAQNTKQASLRSNGISMDFVRDEIASCKASRKIVILDCCYSGAFFKGTMGGGYQDEINQFTGSYVITSADHKTLAQFNPDDPTSNRPTSPKNSCTCSKKASQAKTLLWKPKKSMKK